APAARIKSNMSIFSSKTVISSSSSKNTSPRMNSSSSSQNSPRPSLSLEQAAPSRLSGSYKNSTFKTSSMAHAISRM
ncbi:hypothetical protein BGZ82_000208, partial [Podila clonocystis]